MLKPRIVFTAVVFCSPAIVVAILSIAAQASTGAGIQSPVPPSPQEQTNVDLERKKLTEETRKLELENEREASTFGAILAAAPFATAMVGIATLGFAIIKQQRDNFRQRDEDRNQRIRETQARFDSDFTNAMSNFGAESTGLQAAGAASLLRLQARQGDQFQREILLFCLAQLRIGVSDKVKPILMEVFQKALRECAAQGSLPDLFLVDAKLEGLDISKIDFGKVNVDLSRATLTGAQMRGANVWKLRALQADLSQAECSNANFGPARFDSSNCRRARFRGARMASSKWRAANASGADFTGGQLQSADFRGATLQGVTFTSANVNDAYFAGSIIDAATFQSLARAKNIGRAHFDEAQEETINQYIEEFGGNGAAT